MSRFANLADAGAHLMPLIGARVADFANPCLLAIMPNGVPVAEPIADGLGLPIVAAPLDRTGDPTAGPLPDLSGRTAIVIDDGVETGTAARLIGDAARTAGAASVILAVPVCSREVRPLMDRVYDEVIVVEQPLARRDLRWHFDEFDTIDQAEAERRLAAR